MRARTNTILKTDSFSLLKKTNQKTNRTHYIVQLNLWPNGRSWGNGAINEIRNFFDPYKSRGAGLRWKFRTRKEAEHLITVATIKWS